MPATSRSSARRTALLAQAGLAVFVLAGIPAAILALPAIPDPAVAPPDDLRDIRPVNASAGAQTADLSAIGRGLTLAGAFPPPPETTPTIPGPGTGPGGTTPTPGASSGGPAVRFLGAIAEPNQFVALLTIDDRQKFLRPGQSFVAASGTVTVVSCSATEVQIEVDSDGRGPADRRTLQVAARSGPAFTTPGESPVASTGPATNLGASPEMSASSIPGMPPGFTPPPGMSPQQIEQIRRAAERAQRDAGDGSQ